MLYKNNEYISVIGTIVFKDILEEQEVSSKNNRFNTKGLGECKIEVYGPNEGDIPHFHLFNKDKSFESCICIYSANYFAHGGKYKDKLNSKQFSELNKWLKEKSSKAPGNISNWQVIATMWETNNPDCKFPKYKKVDKQPIYINMVNYTS